MKPGQVTWTVCCYTVADVSDQNPDLSENAPDGRGGEGLPGASARVLENLAELEPELVSAGMFGPGGETVALFPEASGWGESASELLQALAAGSGDEVPDSAHIASNGGEVFVVYEAGLSLVAVTGRFVLASLTAYDMRMALRDAAGRSAGSEASLPFPRARNEDSGDA